MKIIQRIFSLNNLCYLKQRKTVFLLLCVILVLTSCTQDFNEDINGKSNDKVSFSIQFINPGSKLKAESTLDDRYFGNKVRLIAYKEGVSTPVINSLLDLEDTSNDYVKQKTLLLDKGTYTIYFIANAENTDRSLAVSPVLLSATPLSSMTITETELQKTLLSYYNDDIGKKPGLPLVMTAKKTVTLDSAPVNLNVELEYTCVRVSYEIIFDKEYSKGGKSVDPALIAGNFQLTSIQFKNLAKKSNLFSNGALVEDRTLFDDISTKINTTDLKPLLRSPKEDPGDDNPIVGWVYRNNAYIPECLYDEANHQTFSCLELKGKLDNSSLESTYTINLIEDKDIISKKITPRGTHYMISAHIMTREGIDTKINVQDWTPQEVCVSVGEYELWVSKTIISIDSFKKEILSYTTNANKIMFEWKNSNDSENCSFIRHDDNTTASGSLTFQPGINSKVGEGEAILLAKIYDDSGNIILTKEILVKYDFEAFLKVNPEVLIFNWSDILLDNPSATTYEKKITYTTNLLNVSLNSSSHFEYNGHKVDIIDGKIIVVAKKVNNTEEFTFDVIATEGQITLKKTVKVIVKPDLSKVYRINFRVINDPLGGTADVLKRWENCCIYMYNENKSAGTKREFTGRFPGTPLDYKYGDGWFTVDISKDPEIEPGKTLVMFTYSNNEGWKVQQRYPGHMAPGIPLFNFDDGEGWFVYDPSVETGKLSFYDDKPTIDNLTYKFHFRVKKAFWDERPQTAGSENYPRLWLYTAYGEKGDPARFIYKPHTYSPFNNKFWWDFDNLSANRYWNDDSNKLDFEKYVGAGDVVLTKSVTLDALFDNHVKDFHFSIQRNRDLGYAFGNNDKYLYRYPEYRDYYLEYSKDNWSGDRNTEADKYYIFNGENALEGWIHIQLGTPPSKENMKWLLTNPNW